MYSLNVKDEGKGLVLILKKHFDSREAELLYEQACQDINKLKKGFSVLTDLSSLESVDIKVRPFIVKLMDLLNSNGVSKVVRIIPNNDKDIGFMIMSMFHYSSDVAIYTCKTHQEAEKHLKL